MMDSILSLASRVGDEITAALLLCFNFTNLHHVNIVGCVIVMFIIVMSIASANYSNKIG
jgi:hypothetical protein